MNKKKIYIGLHVPKTAGSSFIAAMDRCYPYPEFIQLTNLRRLFFESKLLPEEINNKDLVKVIFGHNVNEKIFSSFPDRMHYLFTFIRDPRALVASHYAFKCRLSKLHGVESPSFDKFLSTRPKNFICNVLIKRFPTFAGTKGDLLSRAVNVLKCFDFVASTEDFNQKLNTLSSEMNKNIDINESPRNTTEKSQYKSIMGDVSYSDDAMKHDIELYNMYMANSNVTNPFVMDVKRKARLIKNMVATEGCSKANHRQLVDSMIKELHKAKIPHDKVAFQVDILSQRIKLLKTY
jgi:hypothetical protein